MNHQLIIASGNPGKVQEIKAILGGLGIPITSAGDLGINLDIQETGNTYSENARLKAAAYQGATHEIVLADDSGLEVDALDGAPGIYSARFSPKVNATDADRRRYLLDQLQGKPRLWTAHFHCTAVLAAPGGKIIEKHGQCSGEILDEERGEGGFGYDPVFFIPEFNATMAELQPEIKNAISHRARAVSALIPAIKACFSLE